MLDQEFYDSIRDQWVIVPLGAVIAIRHRLKGVAEFAWTNGYDRDGCSILLDAAEGLEDWQVLPVGIEQYTRRAHRLDDDEEERPEAA